MLSLTTLRLSSSSEPSFFHFSEKHRKTPSSRSPCKVWYIGKQMTAVLDTTRRSCKIAACVRAEDRLSLIVTQSRFYQQSIWRDVLDIYTSTSTYSYSSPSYCFEQANKDNWNKEELYKNDGKQLSRCETNSKYKTIIKFANYFISRKFGALGRKHNPRTVCDATTVYCLSLIPLNRWRKHFGACLAITSVPPADTAVWRGPLSAAMK